MSTLKVNQIQNLNGDVLLSSSGGDANLTLSGELRGPATFVIDPAAVGDNTGTVQIKGNLQVDGTQTTINSSTLTVDDKNIVLADGATTDAAADGGGITLKGASDKTITWIDSTNAWTSSEIFSVPLGTQEAPSLIFGADVNTGLYSPGADQVAISTNGTGRLFINQNGNVAIGTSSYAGNFHVYAPSGGVSAVFSANTSNAYDFSRLLLTGGNLSANEIYLGDGLDSDIGKITYNNDGNYLAFTTNANERLRITSDGKVGLGTDSPGAQLTVNNTSGSEVRIDTTGGANVDSVLSYYENGVDRARIYWDGVDNDLYLETTTGDFCINPAGNVGIGTIAPNQILEVVINDTTSSPAILIGNGDTSARSALLRNNNDATSFDILASNSSSSAKALRFMGHHSVEFARFENTGTFRVKGAGTAGSTDAVQLNGSAPANSLLLDASGRLGLGTSSPSNRFHVKETNTNSIVGVVESSSTASYLSFQDSNTASAGNVRCGAVGDDFFIRVLTGGGLLVNSSGNVGIGTDNPSEKLQVIGTVASRGASSGQLTMLHDGTNGSVVSTSNLLLYSGGTSNLILHTNALQRLFIDSSGNVGISTNSPGSRLAVNGSITESTDGGTTYHNVVTAQDIGTDPNQVPLNQFLGQLAFMDEIGDVPTASSAPQENLSVNFEYVSNTSIKIRMRGSDGVVRSVTLTLS